MNKRLLIFESRGDLNQCISCRETWYTRHICFPRQSTYPTRTLPTGGFHTWQPFTLTQQGWTDSLLSRKSAPDFISQPGWVARGTHFNFSPKHNHWSSVLKPNIYWWIGYLGLLDPYYDRTPPEKAEVCLSRSYRGILNETRMHKHTHKHTILWYSSYKIVITY
jgi:hypothetical protein